MEVGYSAAIAAVVVIVVEGKGTAEDSKKGSEELFRLAGDDDILVADHSKGRDGKRFSS